MAYIWLDRAALYDLFPDGTFLTDHAVDHYLETKVRQP